MSEIAAFDPYVWLAILAITLATFITRSSPLLLGERLRIPPLAEAALRFAPACALAAIIAPDLLLTNGELNLSLNNARLISGCIASAIFIYFRSISGTILGGMLIYWLLTFGPSLI
jgi:branched-subunit amino acid transport protein